MTSLASVFVEVRPDTSHFSTELKSTLAKTREAVEVAATLDTKKLKPELDALKAELKAVTVTKAKITADASQASARVRELKVQLEGLNEEVRINGGPTPELTAKIRAVKAEMATIKDQRAKLSVDSSAASAHIKAISAQLAVFGSKEYTADVNVNSRGINFAFRGVGMLTTAIVSLAPIAVPVLATVTAGVGVLGSAFMSAGAAAGLYGVVAAGALGQAKKDLKTIQDLNKKAAAQTDPAKAAALRKQAKDMLASLPVAERQLLNVMADFEGKFREFLRGVGPAVYGPMVKGINLVTSLFKPVTPLINAVGGAVEGLLDDLVRLSKGQGFRNVLAFFELTGPAAITHFGHIAGNILKGIYFLFRGFAPFQGQFLSSFEKMTARFARWSEGFGSSNQFRGFMRYAQKVLPDVRDLFIQLTQFVGRFIVALGPLGGIEIKLLLAVLRGLNTLPPRVLQGIAVGITAVVVGLKAWELGAKAVVIATKAWAAAQWLVNAAVDANPLGLFIIGLAAVAAGLIYAYKHSATFRRIVNAAMGAVKNVAMDVVHWFTRSFIPFFTRTIPNAFQSTLSWVKRNWPTILAILTGPIGLATLFISRHWDTITKAFRDAKNWVVGTFKRAWNDVQGVIMTPLNNVRDAIGRLFGRGGPIRTAFSDAVKGIKNIWSDLSGAVRSPIRYIVNTVFNKGIVPFVNRIPFIPGTLHTIGGFDVGGYTGRGGKYEPAGIVHRNEHVIRSESTESVNRAAPGFLDHLNRHGAKALQGILPGYFLGGGVTPAAGAISQHSRAQYPWAQWSGDINEPGSSDIGHPVHAWKSGVVAMVKHLTTSYGNHIRLNHANNERTLYAHLSRVLVHVGQRVSQGQTIGLKGGTGNVTGPHLHFELSGGHNPLSFSGPGVGSLGAPGYGGPSAASASSSLNPARWIRALSNMGPWGGALGGMIGGVVGRLRSTVVDKIKSAVAVAGRALTGGAGPSTAAGVRQWAPTARQVLVDLGQPTSLLGSVLRRMSQESGGNPRAVNHTDSNARAGYPSTGLMQVIRGTYNAYRPHPDFGPFLNGVSVNPYSNIYAALNYAVHRYPSLAYAMNKSGGYDFGGIARGIGFMPKMTPLPERVLSPRQTDLHDRQTVALEKLAAGGGGRAVFKIYDVDRKLIGAFEGIADDRIAVASDFGDMETRAGL